MSFSALIPSSQRGAANAALDANNWGADNFQSRIGPSGYAGFHSHDDPLFRGDVETIDGVVVSDIEGEPSERVDAVEAWVTGSGPLVLWDASLDPAPIYVPDDVAPRTLEAANLLADYIEKSSGKTKPTVTQQSVGDSVPTRAIKVGYPHETRSREETIISCPMEGPLLLTGADEFDPDNPDFVGHRETEPNYMKQAGSYYAVMTFVHEWLGVVIGWPGVLGEAVPVHSELKIDPTFKRKAPDAMSRQFLSFSRPGHSEPPGLAKEWLKRQRNFWSSLINIGHPFDGYYDRFHPNGDPGGNREDLFALQLDGSRSGFPFGAVAKLETGDPALVDKWFEVNVEEAKLTNPLQSIFSCAANDSFLRGHSLDPRAIEMDYLGEDAQTFNFQYETGSVTRPALTDREVNFANRCADKLAETYPDDFVNTAAYGFARPAPKIAVPRDNVIINNVANDFSNPNLVDPFSGNTYRQDFEDWLEVFPKNQLWRPNTGNGHGHTFGMWMTQVHRIGNRLRDIIPKGCIGIRADQFWEHWSNQWPVYYCVSQLLWDRRKTVDGIMEKAYNALFGPASSHVKAYYEATETAIENWEVHSLNIRDVPDLWNQSLIDQLQSHLDSAASAVVADSDEEKRIEWVQAGLDWSKAIKRAAEYLIEWESPGTVTNTTNLATQANAIESDVDGTAGWSPLFATPTWRLSSQSDVTNGSNFAFLMDANTDHTGNTVGFERAQLPGTSSDTYLVSIDIRHTGVGSRWVVRKLGEKMLDVFPDDTDWRTGQFIANGGDVIEIREGGPPREGAVYVDNFLVQEAVPTDQAAIEVDWQAHVDAAIAAATDPSWDIPPVSVFVTKNGGGGRIPSPGDHGSPDPEPGFQ